MQDFDIFRLDGHTLRVFVAVCETGSISETAALFDLTQPTISHTIDKLRSAFNDPLFVKSGRGITPTEKSLLLLPRIQTILAEVEGLVASDDYDPKKDVNPFRIAAPTEPIISHIKNLHTTFRKQAPNAQFVLLPQISRIQIAEALSDYGIDLAITVSGEKYPPSLNFQPYWQDEMVICYDPDQRGPIADIDEYINAKHAMVSFGGNSKSEVEKDLSARKIGRKIVLTASSISNLASLLKGTDIITTMPESLARTHFFELANAPPPFPLNSIKFDLVWHRRYDASARNAWLRSLILETRQDT